MATVQHVTYAIECDQCGEQPIHSLDDCDIEAARYAQRLGWQVAVDGDDPGSDLCPECAAAEAADDPQCACGGTGGDHDIDCVRWPF